MREGAEGEEVMYNKQRVYEEVNFNEKKKAILPNRNIVGRIILLAMAFMGE